VRPCDIDTFDIDKKTRNFTAEQVVLWLHKNGFSMLESVKILRKLKCLSLGEAKAIVGNHSAWRDAVTMSGELERAAISAAGEIGSGVGSKPGKC